MALASGLLSCLVGCGGGIESPAPAPWPAVACDVRADALRIEPSDSEIDVGPDRGSVVAHRAIAHFPNSAATPVAAAWRLSLPTAGEIDAEGRFVPSGAVGGELRVFARAHGAESASRLLLKWVAEFPLGPSEDAQRFAPSLDRTDAAPPNLIEPSGEADFSAGGPPPSFRWNRAGHDVFRLRFQTPTTDVSLFTRDDRLELPARVRAGLEGSNPGQRVRAFVEAADDDASAVFSSTASASVQFCQTELCNGRDDDCDLETDEDCVDSGGGEQAASACP